MTDTQGAQESHAEVSSVSIEQKETEGLSQSQIIRKRFFHHRGAIASLIVLILVIILAFTSVGLHLWELHIHGWWPYTWNEILPTINNGKPSLNLVPGDHFRFGPHPFGQDEVGRDIFAVVMRGTQQSIMIMFIVGIIATLLGVVIGALSGYYRGKTDSLLMRMTDIFITIPYIVVGAVIGLAVGNLGAALLGVALGLFTWTSLARVVRGEFLTLREREFVDAARVSGARDRRIIFKHILPNAMGVIVVSATLLMATAILAESALSYLGFGVKPPDTSLGAIISENKAAFDTRPWLFWWPGLFIIMIALCINFVGDGLRDAYDPRQKRLPSPRAIEKAAARKKRDAQLLSQKTDHTENGTKL